MVLWRPKCAKKIFLITISLNCSYEARWVHNWLCTCSYQLEGVWLFCFLQGNFAHRTPAHEIFSLFWIYCLIWASMPRARLYTEMHCCHVIDCLETCVNEQLNRYSQWRGHWVYFCLKFLYSVCFFPIFVICYFILFLPITVTFALSVLLVTSVHISLNWN